MRAALITPFLSHIPLHPSAYLGYGRAVLQKRYDLTVMDMNAHIYYRNKDKLKTILAHIDESQVVFDNADFYPFYLDLLNHVEREYEEISWQNYEMVFITMPSWFVTVPTETIVKLSALIKRNSPNTKVAFFGNSLGTWTDEKQLTKNNISIRHINNIFESDSSFAPVNYDALPTPVYENMNKYIFNMLPFRLKHGCQWGKCRFCSLAKGWNAGYLERSAKTVITELEELIDRYNPKMLICTDNTLNGNNLVDFCRNFKSFHKPWGGMARADLSKEEIRALQKAGCRLIYFGLESGSDGVLHQMNKGISTTQISVFLKNLHDYGIFSAPSLFVGAPGEKEIDFKKTIQFILDHQAYVDILNVFPLIVTPASEYAVKRNKANTQTLVRLFQLVKAVSDVGIKVCVGEQSDEYAIFRSIYEGDIN